MSDKWELKINEGFRIIDRFEDAVGIIKDELNEYFDIDQCFCNRMPFSVGVLESQLYDENKITDEQIIVFERIQMLLNRIFIKEDIAALNYIKHDYSMHYEDDYIYDLNIIRKEDEIILSTKVDCKEYIDYLETNMFTFDSNKEYYFRSNQKVAVSSPDDRFSLDFIAELDILLKKK